MIDGEKLTLECDLTGDRFTWRKNGEIVRGSGSDFIRENVKTEDSGSYTCQKTDPDGLGTGKFEKFRNVETLVQSLNSEFHYR